MPKIYRLQEHEAQKIAAGEVVERPANVVKELIENAIDAGATQITVYIQEGGKKLIRVVDNGCGMDKEDARLCFEHHATSKLTSVDQLNSIVTFGFRGEALSSIASVSKTILITKQSDAHQGIRLELDHGAVLDESIIAANQGTDIAIQDLFFNVPARKKFLKSNDTETRAIAQLFNAFCFDYTNVSFKLFINDSLTINCPATPSLNNRLTQLFDPNHAPLMLECSSASKDGSVKIKGYISNHQFTRYDRNSIYFFVNQRWVKQQKLSSALLKGYLNVLPPQRYPAACIFIDVDPEQVDINIHPRKEEVQFLHPRIIEQLVQNMVRTTLETHLSTHLKKEVTFEPARQVPHTNYSAISGLQFEPMYNIKNNTTPPHLEPTSFTYSYANSMFKDEPFLPEIDHQPIFTAQTVSEQLSLEKPYSQTSTYDTSVSIENAAEQSYTLIGQYHKTYLLLEQKDGLFLIDQHAAHERILYEIFAHRFDEVATVALLFPQAITLKSDDIKTLEPHLDLFLRNGIDIAIVSDTQLIVRSTPVHLKNQSIEDLIHHVISWILETYNADEDQFFKAINERLHAQMACKAAVKACDILTQEQMHQLMKDLHTTKNRFACPHGRPTGWLLSLHEIEKKFKRKV
jgi:DNA mismatch repair protein MutL